MQYTWAVFLFLFSFFIAQYGSAQTDSCHLRISLLTCSPGEELYSTFGHTALRVTDAGTGMDMVFNYGTFDDSDPNFYFNFTKGLMNYALSAYPFTDFAYEYQVQQRGVIEQELQLSCSEKDTIFNALRENTREKNRFYNYYFHTDNCTTRARDMIARHTASPLQFRNILPADVPSYRDLLHDYLDKGHQPWSKFGIDILLGSNLDKKLTNEQAMFLPDYLMKGFDSASMTGKPLVAKKQTVLAVPARPAENSPWFTPFALLMALFVVVAGLSIYPPRWSIGFLRVFDICFFLLLGMLGVLLLTLWLIRVDDVCRNNFNLLWAFPTHLPVVLAMTRRRKWMPVYFKVVCIITLLLGAAWFILPQALHPSIAPLLGLILVRAWYRSRQ